MHRQKLILVMNSLKNLVILSNICYSSIATIETIATIVTIATIEIIATIATIATIKNTNKLIINN